MSFLSNAPPLGGVASGTASSGLSLSGAPSLSRPKKTPAFDDGGEDADDLFGQILAGERKHSTKSSTMKSARTRTKKKAKKKSSKNGKSKHRSKHRGDDENTGARSSAASKSGEAATRDDASMPSFGGGYVPSAVSGPSSRRGASIADRTLASMGDLDSQLFGIGSSNTRSGATTAPANKKQVETKKATTTDLSLGDSWDDDIDDLLDEGKPVGSSGATSPKRDGDNARRQMDDDQSRMRAELGLEESGDYLMDSFASSTNGDLSSPKASGGVGGGYRPSAMNSNQDDSLDNVDIGGYKPWEKQASPKAKSSSLSSSSSSYTAYPSTTSSSTQPQQAANVASSSSSSSPSSPRNDKRTRRENNNEESSITSSSRGIRSGTTTSTVSRTSTASNAAAVRTLKRQIDSLEANAASASRRSDHERRAREVRTVSVCFVKTRV